VLDYAAAYFAPDERVRISVVPRSAAYASCLSCSAYILLGRHGLDRDCKSSYSTAWSPPFTVSAGGNVPFARVPAHNPAIQGPGFSLNCTSAV